MQTLARLTERAAGVFQVEAMRLFLWLPVLLGVGIGVYFALPREPAAWIGPIAVAMALALAWSQRKGGLSRIAALALLAVCSGVLAGQLRTLAVDAPILPQGVAAVTLTGEILEVEAKGKGSRVLLHRVAGLPVAPVPRIIRVKLAGSHADLQAGERIRLRAKLAPPPGPAAPGAFDFARQAYFQQLGAVGFSLGRPQRLAPVADESARRVYVRDLFARWRIYWSGARQAVAARVEAALPEEQATVATALMTGQRGEIPEAVMEDMRQSGLAHLLAISGLHMGLVAGLLFFAVRAALALFPVLALTYPIKKWAAVVAGFGAFCYLFLAGASVPSQRAFIMVSIVLLAILVDRRAFSLRLVAWAALAVLLMAPESLLSVSFQMSFAAVIALVAVYEALGQEARLRISQRRFVVRLVLYLGGVCLTSLIAALATGPFAAYHFNRIAIYGLAANFIAVPMTAFWIMPWSIVAFLLMPLGLESWALNPMGWGIELILTVAAEVASWPGAAPLVAYMPRTALLAIVAGGLWLCLWQRVWRLAGLLPIALGLVLAATAPTPDLLVSGSGRLMALKGPDGGLWLSSRRVERFTAGVWKRRGGHAGETVWPTAGQAAAGDIACDSLGCIFKSKGETVAFVRDGRALMEDCAVASVLISVEPLRDRPCRRPKLVIDRFDLWREGPHAIWLGNGKITVRSVAEVRGDRPWSRRPESHDSSKKPALATVNR